MMTMLLKSILIFIFVVISISDWRTHKIPDRWNAGILLVAVLLALVDPSVSWQERILGMFAVSVPMACLLFLFREALAAVISSLLQLSGWQSGEAGRYGKCGSNPTGRDLLYPASGRKRNGQKTAFAFGLFLCMGMTAAMVFGDAWAAWFYQDRLMSAKVLFQFLPEQFQLCFVISGFQFRECL